MNIFIDEGGQFTPSDGLGVVSALSLPTSQTGRVRRELLRLTVDWPRVDGELKGGQLSADHLSALVDLLFRRNAILQSAVVDVAAEGDAAVAAHKLGQCEGFTAHITDDHQPQMVEQLWALRRRLEAMPNQLYVQYIMLRELVCSVAENTALYFSQRKSEELGEFNWIIDAKDPTRVTPQEALWRDTLGPMIESRSREKPFSVMRNEQGFNYTYFERAYSFVKSAWRPDGPRQQVEGYDIKKMISERLSFVDSRSDILIQAIDILTSFMRRSLQERITDPAIFHSLGRLQVRRRRGNIIQPVEMLTFSDNTNEHREWVRIMKQMGLSSRSMLRNGLAD